MQGKMLRCVLLMLLAYVDGCFISSFGPLIPLFSAATANDETHYAYLFFVRSSANIFGGFLIKYLIKIFSNNSLLLFFQLIATICLFTSSLSLSSLNLAVNLFLVASAFVGQVVLTYDVIFKLFLKDHPDYWSLMFGFVFGMGAMSGPLIVIACKLQTFTALAVVELVVLCAFVKYPLPDLVQASQPQEKVKQEGMNLSSKSVFWISCIFFLFAIEELGLASWISTYSIKSGVSDSHGSALYSSFFWFPNCLGRLVWIYIRGNVQQRLGWAFRAVAVTLVIAVTFQYLQLYSLVCIFTPITSGFLMSGVYALGMSWSVDNGFLPSNQSNADFVLANALGQGLLIMPMGYSMNLFGFKFLMIETCLFSFLSVWAYREACKSMENDKSVYNNRLVVEAI